LRYGSPYSAGASARAEWDDPATDAQLRFVVRDAKSREKLWGLTAHARAAVLQSNRDKNFEEALGAVVVEMKRIAGPVPAAIAKN